jgi:hypothetical protein
MNCADEVCRSNRACAVVGSNASRGHLRREQLSTVRTLTYNKHTFTWKMKGCPLGTVWAGGAETATNGDVQPIDM